MSGEYKRKRNSDEFKLPPRPRKQVQHYESSHRNSQPEDPSVSLVPNAQKPRIVVNEPSFEDTQGSDEQLDRPLSTQNNLIQNLETSHGQSTSSIALLLLHTPSSVEETISPAESVAQHQQISYSLRLTILPCEQQLRAIQNTIPIDVAPRSYEEIESHATQFCETQYPNEMNKEFLFRSGSITFLGSRRKTTLSLSSPLDWYRFRFIRHSDLLPFARVEISRDYISLKIRPDDDSTFAQTKRDEICDLMSMSKAFDGREYIRRLDLDRLTSEATIRLVVMEDNSLKGSRIDKDEIVKEIYNRARTLFAMCVCAPLSMDCLKVLVDKSLVDANRQLLTEHDLCHKGCRANFKNLVNTQGGFRAAEFALGQHYKLHPPTVIPLKYHEFVGNEASLLQRTPSGGLSSNEEIDEKREKSRCGTGAYSNVFRVRLDPDYNTLDEDVSKIYALKEFKDRPQRKGADFQKELKILKRLQLCPHEHIVTHLVTWTQSDRYYMLFPYAQCNLRLYMQQWNFGDFSSEKNCWFLDQICGLSDALRNIHNLSTESDPNQESPGAAGASLRHELRPENSRSDPNRLNTPTSRVRESGWHHDLKPENILFFPDHYDGQDSRTAGYGRFCIADFGSGKVHTYRSISINTQSPNGTLTYEPPERLAEGRTSRPYDIWSLGCVYLELILWAIVGYDAVREFGEERLGRRNLSSKVEVISDDAFFHVNVQNEVEVRPAVTNKIRFLETEVHRRQLVAFGGILSMIEQMLNPKHEQRISAIKLWNHLDYLRTHVTGDAGSSEENDLEPLVPSVPPGLSERRTPSPQLLITDRLTQSPLDSRYFINRRRTNSNNSSTGSTLSPTIPLG